MLDVSDTSLLVENEDGRLFKIVSGTYFEIHEHDSFCFGTCL